MKHIILTLIKTERHRLYSNNNMRCAQILVPVETKARDSQR
jgi:hypothetical protein